MGVLRINLGPKGLKKDGIPSIDRVLTSLITHHIQNFDKLYILNYCPYSAKKNFYILGKNVFDGNLSHAYQTKQ